MLDEEMKELLKELKMSHYIEELEKVQIKDYSMTEKTLLPKHFDEKEENHQLEAHIKVVNSILAPQRQRRKKLLALCVALVCVGGGVYYSYWGQEPVNTVVIDKKVEEPVAQATPQKT